MYILIILGFGVLLALPAQTLLLNPIAPNSPKLGTACPEFSGNKAIGNSGASFCRLHRNFVFLILNDEAMLPPTKTISVVRL